MKLFLTALVCAANLAAIHAPAATPAENYKAKCSTCHDAGLASAPKVGDKAEWARRNRQGTDALYQGALLGKPNTAMMAKGGFNELQDAEVIAIVDYLLAQAGQKQRATPAAKTTAPAAATRPANVEKVDDETLVARIKTALGKTKGIVAKDIKPEAADGNVILRGVVDNAQQIKLAETVTAKIKGVRQIDNKLIPKDLFAWD
jgi:cytochrome c5